MRKQITSASTPPSGFVLFTKLLASEYAAHTCRMAVTPVIVADDLTKQYNLKKGDIRCERVDDDIFVFVRQGPST
jgi:hypothetical protein